MNFPERKPPATLVMFPYGHRMYIAVGDGGMVGGSRYVDCQRYSDM